MNLFVLYLVLLKATVTTFGGMTSLPIIRDELVVRRGVLTDEQLNTAVVVGRSTPGPNGLHVVCSGYFVAGLGGALVGFLALITPALLAIPLIVLVQRFHRSARLRSTLSAIVIASVGLVAGTAYNLSQSALDAPMLWGIAALSLVALVRTSWDTVWVIAGAAALALVAAWIGG